MKRFEEPALEVEQIELLDVIATSDGQEGGSDDWGGGFTPV